MADNVIGMAQIRDFALKRKKELEIWEKAAEIAETLFNKDKIIHDMEAKIKAVSESLARKQSQLDAIDPQIQEKSNQVRSLDQHLKEKGDKLTELNNYLSSGYKQKEQELEAEVAKKRVILQDTLKALYDEIEKQKVELGFYKEKTAKGLAELRALKEAIVV